MKKLLFLGSSCIYPRVAHQPMREEELLTGPLEPTNEWYAVAKIAGIKLCQAYRRQHGADFISVMPTNLYGPGDNYHPENSHVVAALIRRFHQAKQEGVPEGEGVGHGHAPARISARRTISPMRASSSWSTIRTSSTQRRQRQEVTIAEFAKLVADVVGYRGELVFDPSRPDGMPRKLLDSSRLAGMGWRARTSLRAGLEQSYAAFMAGNYHER